VNPSKRTAGFSFLDAVVSKLRLVPGVVDVWPVDASERTAILQMEEKASGGFGLPGLDIVNEGVKVVLGRQSVVCINHSSSLRHPSMPILLLTAEKDVIGREVWEEDEVTRFRADPNVIFLGKDFVLFRNRLEATRGKPVRFVIGPQSFPEIETIQGICDVVSASVSLTTDLYIKRRAGWETSDPDRGTVLIGFNSNLKPNVTSRGAKPDSRH